jgi:hypothetical protein
MKPLTSEAVYRLAQLTEYLRRVKNYDPVVFEDGSYEKYGQKLILSSMRWSPKFRQVVKVRFCS